MTHARQHTIQVVAHRGASEDAPEHTLAAYRKAIEDGADALECDVRLTADGHLVCVHDRRVNRTSNGRGAVSALELADLAALDFGSWKGRRATRRPTGSPTRGPRRTSVLTLERLLELVADAGRRVELAIETKHPTRWAGQVEERLLELLRRFGLDAPAAAGDSPGTGHELLGPLAAPGPGRRAAPAHRLSDAVRLAAAARRTAARRACGSRARASGSCATTPATSSGCTARATRCTSGR